MAGKNTMGIITTKTKFRQFADTQSRIDSFNRSDQRWSSTYPVSIDKLVKAGLFYTGVADSVKCYYCGGGLRNWEPNDDPMVEHAKWYPDCSHLILVKGLKYAESVCKAGNNDVNTAPEIQGVKVRNVKNEDPYLSSNQAKAVLEYDFPKSFVIEGVKKLSKRNSPFSAAELLEAVTEISEHSNDLHVDGGEESESPDEILKLQHENEELKMERMCQYCKKELATIVFLPCGHMMSCGDCAAKKLDDRCTRCYKTVNGLVRATLVDFSEIPG